MSNEQKKSEAPDLRLYAENRRRFPAEQLAPYYGKFVAWSPDGTRIVASGKEREEVWKQLEAAGVDPSQFVNDYIDPANVLQFPNGFLAPIVQDRELVRDWHPRCQ